MWERHGRFGKGKLLIGGTEARRGGTTPCFSAPRVPNGGRIFVPDFRPAHIRGNAFMSRTLLAGLAALALVGLASPAFAHAHLKAATPAAGGSVASAPSELDLDFSEDLNLKFSGVTVKGPDGAVETGAASLAKDNTRLVVPLKTPLAAGAYTVDWHALSADGHKTKGSYSFTVEP